MDSTSAEAKFERVSEMCDLLARAEEEFERDPSLARKLPHVRAYLVAARWNNEWDNAVWRITWRRVKQLGPAFAVLMVAGGILSHFQSANSLTWALWKVAEGGMIALVIAFFALCLEDLNRWRKAHPSSVVVADASPDQTAR